MSTSHETAGVLSSDDAMPTVVALTFFFDCIRLADLRRLGQVGTGTSGTVWLVACSACAAQQAWTEHDKLFARCATRKQEPNMR